MRAAIIENDMVVNVIVLDDLSQAPDGCECIEAPRGLVEIGFIRQDDGSFAPPEVV